MIVYRELSSLEKDLGISGKALYTLSNQIHKHYKKVSIPKNNGNGRPNIKMNDIGRLI